MPADGIFAVQNGWHWNLPSGKHTKNDGKPSFIAGKIHYFNGPFSSIFDSYVTNCQRVRVGNSQKRQTHVPRACYMQMMFGVQIFRYHISRCRHQNRHRFWGFNGCQTNKTDIQYDLKGVLSPTIMNDFPSTCHIVVYSIIQMFQD